MFSPKHTPSYPHKIALLLAMNCKKDRRASNFVDQDYDWRRSSSAGSQQKPASTPVRAPQEDAKACAQGVGAETPQSPDSMVEAQIAELKCRLGAVESLAENHKMTVIYIVIMLFKNRAYALRYGLDLPTEASIRTPTLLTESTESEISEPPIPLFPNETIAALWTEVFTRHRTQHAARRRDEKGRTSSVPSLSCEKPYTSSQTHRAQHIFSNSSSCEKTYTSSHTHRAQHIH